MSTRKFFLDSDAQSRNKAVAARSLKAGETLLSTSALVTALLKNTKGQRCDFCCRRTEVKACSRCKEVWYCDGECQKQAWQTGHKKLCSVLRDGFRVARSFIAQDPELQANSELLMSLYALIASSSEGALFEQMIAPTPGKIALDELENKPLDCFWDLISSPSPRPLPVLPSTLLAARRKFFEQAWSRFDCNNFVLHNISTLQAESTVYALGIFPWASRSFNHSCAPNAWSAFRLEHRKAWLEVRALRDIEEGQEITIPYLDPALTLPERQLRLRQTYQFSCQCSRCTLEKRLPASATFPDDPQVTEEVLTATVFTQEPPNMNVGSLDQGSLLVSLPFIRDKDFMPSLSKRFEAYSHDGPYLDAWRTGRALIATCTLVYPRNYPLTGYYGLELAKVCWNANFSRHIPPNGLNWLQCMAAALNFAEDILIVVGGEEEDKEAPGLQVVKSLRKLLTEEGGDYGS